MEMGLGRAFVSGVGMGSYHCYRTMFTGGVGWWRLFIVCILVRWLICMKFCFLKGQRDTCIAWWEWDGERHYGKYTDTAHFACLVMSASI